MPSNADSHRKSPLDQELPYGTTTPPAAVNWPVVGDPKPGSETPNPSFDVEQYSVDPEIWQRMFPVGLWKLPPP